MQRLPMVTRNHQPFLLMYPWAFESFDFSGYDVVISNSSAFCKGIVTPPGTLHICYCLTPMRWVWNYHAYVDRERLGPAGAHGPAGRHQPAARLGRRDSPERRSVPGHLAHRGGAHQKHYRRDATVIYPPVNCERVHDAAPARSRTTT